MPTAVWTPLYLAACVSSRLHKVPNSHISVQSWMLHTNKSPVTEPTEEGMSSNANSNTQWCIKVSQSAKGSNVTSTKTLFKLKAKGNPKLDLIRLSLGDPSVYGNFKPPSTALDAVLAQLEGKQYHGKGHPCGEGTSGTHDLTMNALCCVSYCYTRVVFQTSHHCRSLVRPPGCSRPLLLSR